MSAPYNSINNISYAFPQNSAPREVTNLKSFAIHHIFCIDTIKDCIL